MDTDDIRDSHYWKIANITLSADVLNIRAIHRARHQMQPFPNAKLHISVPQYQLEQQTQDHQYIVQNHGLEEIKFTSAISGVLKYKGSIRYLGNSYILNISYSF